MARFGQVTVLGKPYPYGVAPGGSEESPICDIWTLLGVDKRVDQVFEAAASYTRLYQEQAAMLRRRAWRYLRDERAAEEVVQEAFLRVIQQAPTFNGEGHAIAYLSTTVTNLCLNRYRDAGRRPTLIAIDSDQAANELDQASAQDHREREYDLIEQERSSLIQEAISQLPEAQRFALVMYEVHDHSFEEIAAQLRIKPSSVRTVLSRARASLREILEQQPSQDLRPAESDFGRRENRQA